MSLLLRTLPSFRLTHLVEGVWVEVPCASLVDRVSVGMPLPSRALAL